MRPLLIRADRWLLRLDKLLAGAAAAAIVIMMAVTAADVVMRYIFNAPLAWAYDLITHYLLVAGFFFGFSYTLRVNHHISVDFFARRLPEQVYHLWLAIGCLAVTFIFAFIAWMGAVDAYHAWRNDEVIFGALIWPTWPAKAIVPIGMVPLALRCLHRAAAHVAARSDHETQAALEIGTDYVVAAED
jgi:TRAP-type C4-dicarboxylate transport system permease small subunit